MKSKFVALAVAVAGFGAAAAMPGAAAASTARATSTCPSGTAVSAYCTCPPGDQVGAYCVIKPTVVYKPYISKKLVFKLNKKSPTLSFWVHYGKNEPFLKSVTVKLPAGLTWNASRFKTNGVTAGAYSVKAKGASIVLKFQSAEPVVRLNFAKGSIVESKSFAKLVAKNKIKQVTFKITVVDAKGKVTTLTQTVKV